MIYFIGDLHLEHKNIIPYCNRPFKSVEEMNKVLIDNWSKVVKPEDTVYFLGDFSFGKFKESIKKVNGKIVFIKGNHDRDLGNYPTLNTLTLTLDGTRFLLTHDPDQLNGIFIADWLIHGHHHNNWPDKWPLINRDKHTINVSAELINYTPISLEDIKKLINTSGSFNGRTSVFETENVGSTPAPEANAPIA